MEDLLRLFTRAHKLLRAETDAAMSEHGVRVGQNLVLEVLWEEDGLAPGELAARLGLTTPTIVNTATRMETAGLVVRRRDPADARLVRLYLTDRARRAEAPIRKARRRLEERVTAALTEEERRHLGSALEKIIDELS
ncbi:MarR family transcriptional regulator [Actinomadura darangshiensis]|uniref:MarR family transcriptional regulator n=1 Tax=Actinomadura darangshiensis TaxID=705336 RepID=A0A4V6PF44_9ACTN|nr:MarR family transcriptional regulator [Actinomadura darangshiensis]TDD91407.1 MarR family transcriptional regulator [Actinomadura darangshiensis]